MASKLLNDLTIQRKSAQQSRGSTLTRLTCANADRIEQVEVLLVYLPLAAPISDAEVFVES